MKRYPLGLPAWGFWVLLVVAGSMLGQVPGVGTVLGVLLIAGGAVWFFFGVKPQRDRRYADYAPVPVTGVERVVFDRLEVVGESHYLAEISRAVGLAGRDLDAVLAWEPKNPHSESKAVVRVDLLVNGERFTCGYIPEGVSVSVVPIVRGVADRGLLPTLPATVFGGTPEKPNYGVILGGGVRRRGVRFE